MSKSTLITLNNGVRLALGFGTLDRSAVEQAAGAVQYAIANGYRLIDTAASTVTSGKSARAFAPVGSIAPRCSSRPNCGWATTATNPPSGI